MLAEHLGLALLEPLPLPIQNGLGQHGVQLRQVGNFGDGDAGRTGVKQSAQDADGGGARRRVSCRRHTCPLLMPVRFAISSTNVWKSS